MQGKGLPAACFWNNLTQYSVNNYFVPFLYFTTLYVASYQSKNTSWMDWVFFPELFEKRLHPADAECNINNDQRLSSRQIWSSETGMITGISVLFLLYTSSLNPFSSLDFICSLMCQPSFISTIQWFLLRRDWAKGSSGGCAKRVSDSG